MLVLSRGGSYYAFEINEAKLKNRINVIKINRSTSLKIANGERYIN